MSKLRTQVLVGAIIIFSSIVVIATNNFIEFVRNLFPTMNIEGPAAILLATILVAVGMINYELFEKLK